MAHPPGGFCSIFSFFFFLLSPSWSVEMNSRRYTKRILGWLPRSRPPWGGITRQALKRAGGHPAPDSHGDRVTRTSGSELLWARRIRHSDWNKKYHPQGMSPSTNHFHMFCVFIYSLMTLSGRTWQYSHLIEREAEVQGQIQSKNTRTGM